MKKSSISFEETRFGYVLAKETFTVKHADNTVEEGIKIIGHIVSQGKGYALKSMVDFQMYLPSHTIQQCKEKILESYNELP